MSPRYEGKPNSLTAREIEVLAAVARGLSNAEIGAALHMSAATAKTHVGRLLTKLGARDRTYLVIATYEAGLVDPRRPVSLADTAQLVGQPAPAGRLSPDSAGVRGRIEEMALILAPNAGIKATPRRCGIHSQMAQCPASNA